MNDKNKRQVYIWPENLEWFNTLPNKSRTLNLLIKSYRKNEEEKEA